MPDYGLYVQNDAGNVQIDSTFKNMEVISTGTIAVSGFTGRYTISFPPCTDPPLLFLRTTSSTHGVLQNLITSGGKYTGAVVWGYGTGTITYFIAATQDNPGTDPYGLWVYDSAGKKVFDSGKRYLKIIDSQLIGNPNGYGGQTIPGFEGTFTHSIVTNPYYCAMGAAFIQDQGQYLNGYPMIRSVSNSSFYFGIYGDTNVVGNYNTYASASLMNTSVDWIYQIPVLIGVLSN